MIRYYFYLVLFLALICVLRNILLYVQLKLIDLDNGVVWTDAPDLTIICRIFSGSAMEFYNIFLVSYLLFWPYRTWLNSDLVVVLDKENTEDHRFGTILAQLPPFPKIKFEDHKVNTFCADWRSEGYSRAMYSSFYADNHTQSSYIGIVDSDALFVTPVTPEDLFIDNKPRVIGINACCTKWEESIYDVLGVIPVATFMFQSCYPLIIKRQHFADCRQHIMKRMNVSTFEEAFKLICSKFPLKYNQYDIIGHYLWHFKRDDYSWHIKSYINHPALTKSMSSNSDVLGANKPLISVTKHGSHDWKYSDQFFKIIYDYLCVGSHMIAGDCKELQRNNAINGTINNLFVDWIYETGNWDERGIKHIYRNMKEWPWSTKEKSYLQAFQDHKNNLRKRDETGVWKWKTF